MASVQAEIEDILDQLHRDHGWRIEQKKGHPTLFPPNGSLRPMTVSMTPGTRNWRRTLGAELRRRGFDLQGTTVRPLAATSVAAAVKTEAATPPPPTPREDATEVASSKPTRKPRAEAQTEQPGPDDIVSVEPAEFHNGNGFPGKTTDKVMQVTYGDGRIVFECTWPECNEQRATPRGVFYHRRSHLSAAKLQSVPTQPTAPVDAEATEARAEWGLGAGEPTLTPPAATEAEQAAVAQAAYEVVEQVIEGVQHGAIEVPAAVEPETAPAAPAEADEVLAQARQIVDTITALTATVTQLQESNARALDALRRAEQHRDDAEGALGEWRQRAHTAEAKLSELRGVLGQPAA